MDNKTIHEGKVTIKVPEFEKITAKAPVFYNPAMELNRDLSVAPYLFSKNPLIMIFQFAMFSEEQV